MCVALFNQLPGSAGATGPSQYRGPASAEMTRILSKVPERVWPLWTGYATLIRAKPLDVETVEAWTRAAGRRPLLWVNRVALGVKYEFGRAVPEAQGAHAFQGEMLPEALAYFATAADYVWNPHDWEAAESCRRARRFVSIMGPLLEQGCLLMSEPPR